MPLDDRDLLELHRLMVLARVLDRAAAKLYGGHFPAEGEEATVVGSFYGLQPDDILAPHYRGPQIVFHMRGMPLEEIFLMLLGRATSYSRGRAPAFSGPVELGFVPWMGGDLGPSIGLATGAAFALRYRRTRQVAVHALGDGTTNRGDFHEAVNVAGLWRLPIVYVIQNNHWSISMPYSRITAAKDLADRAPGYGIPGQVVDGNDVLAVHAAVEAAVARAREGLGPSLIEAKTYRVRGHWAGDPTAYRDATEVEAWRQRDPITRHEALLAERGLLDPAAAREVWAAQEAAVVVAVARAEAAPPAGEAELGLDQVFA